MVGGRSLGGCDAGDLVAVRCWSPCRGMVGGCDVETVSLLKQHRARQRELYLMVGVSATASDRVFTNEVGDPIRPNSIGQAFRRLVDAAGVPVIRLHDLRHTHASHLLMAGVNVNAP